jgi:hypothetical protein
MANQHFNVRRTCFGLFAGFAMLSAATPAMAEGFNLTQLVMADFELKAAVFEPGAGGRGKEVLYLQGKLPGGTYEVIMRCTARPDPEEGSSNCEQVY